MSTSPDRPAAKPSPSVPARYPLPRDHVALARAMARVLLEAARRVGPEFEPGDLVVKHYLSHDGHSDLLVFYGDHDALTSVVEFSRALGTNAGSWIESNAPTDARPR